MAKAVAKTETVEQPEENKEDVIVEHADTEAEPALKAAEKSREADVEEAPAHNTITDNHRSMIDQPNLYPKEQAEKISRLGGDKVVEKHLEDHRGDIAWDTDVKAHKGETEKSEAKAAKEENDK